MQKAIIAGALLLALGAGASSAAVVGKTILATGAQDAVYDPARDVIYISAGGNIVRYSFLTSKLLAPIALGGNLQGIDLSPDGKTLAVATSEHTAGHVVVHLVDLDTLVDNKQVIATGTAAETSTYSVGYFDTGWLGVTAHSDSNGLVPTHMYADGTWNLEWDTSPLASDMILGLSGDLTCGAYGEPSLNKWGTFEHGTNYLNYQYAVTGSPNTGYATANKDCLEVVASGVVFRRPPNYFFAQTGVLPAGGTYGSPLNGIYDPVRPLAYFPYSGTSLVRVLNMGTLLEVRNYDIGEILSPSSNGLTQGRTRISQDGSLLMVVVNDGVHFLRMYARLAATNATASVITGQPVAIPVTATLGIKAKIAYSLPAQPANGTASIVGNTVTYTSNAGFTGVDTFGYTAKYGRATVTGTISVTVTPNHPPVAVNDSFTVAPNSTTLLPVLANDSDADGQALSIIAINQPAHATVAIQGNQVQFIARKADSIQKFNYTISDGLGGTAIATVTVHVVTP
jgi:hypothetical protein